MDSQKVYLYLLAAVYTTSIVHVYGRPASINTPKAVISPAAEYRLNRRGQLLLPATATYRPRATRQLSTKDIKVTSTIGEITDSDLVGLHNNHFNINSDINQNSDSDLHSNKNNNLADSLLSKMYNEIITTRLHSLLRGVEHFSHSPTVNTDIFLPAALVATAAESGQRKMSTDNEEVVYLQAAVTEMPLEELKNLPGYWLVGSEQATSAPEFNFLPAAAINQSSDENAQMPGNEQEQEASNGAEPKIAESELKTDVTSEKYGIDDLFS